MSAPTMKAQAEREAILKLYDAEIAKGGCADDVLLRTVRAALAAAEGPGDAPAPSVMREALEFAAQHMSSDWPERCQEIVRRARAALGDAPPAPAVAPSLLRQPVRHISEISAQIPGGCYCPPDRCDAPVIMGMQTPCLRRKGEGQ